MIQARTLNDPDSSVLRSGAPRQATNLAQINHPEWRMPNDLLNPHHTPGNLSRSNFDMASSKKQDLIRSLIGATPVSKLPSGLQAQVRQLAETQRRFLTEENPKCPPLQLPSQKEKLSTLAAIERHFPSPGKNSNLIDAPAHLTFRKSSEIRDSSAALMASQLQSKMVIQPPSHPTYSNRANQRLAELKTKEKEGARQNSKAPPKIL